MISFIIPFGKISLTHLPEVGVKNSFLGEMQNKLQPLGIRVPDGFAITASAYKFFLQYNKIEAKLKFC
jgi:pyruvate,water dikinase